MFPDKFVIYLLLQIDFHLFTNMYVHGTALLFSDLLKQDHMYLIYSLL